MHIAVIGAGLSGLICARKLQQQGHTVVIFEKNDDVSGRMRTRETELGGFDYGTQYFTATTDQFKKEVLVWSNAGWIAAWDGRLVNLERGDATPANSTVVRYVGVPSMDTLAKILAQGVHVRHEHFVTRVERYGQQWILSITTDAVAIEATAGPFDAVVVAAPADRAIPLLQAVPQFAQQAEQARCAPCWSLMLGFQDTLALQYDGAWVKNSRLSWICREGSKPQRRLGEHWVAQAGIEWSQEHIGDDPERAKEKLLKAFHEATGTQMQPVYALACLWPYAQALQPLPTDCLWDAELRIGVCGDWFACGLDGSGRMENAYLSACALAETIGGLFSAAAA
jgi:renalase